MKTRATLIFKLFLFLFAILLFSTCKKSVDYPNYNNPSDTLQQNVKLIDANNSQLISDSTQLSQGIYKIEFTGTIPVISIGDVIVGAAGDGFLRKVTGITSEGNIYTFQTEQADMSELFNTANFSFQTGISPTKATSSAGGATKQKIKINYIAPGVKLSADGLSYDFSNTIIYQNGGVTFKITQGTAQFDPNFIGNVEYSWGFPTKISCYTDNASMKLNCNLNLNASESVTIQDYKKDLVDFNKSITVYLGGIPVVIVAHTKLTATLNTSVDAVINMNTGITKTYGMTLGATYENGAWTGLWNLTNTENFLPVTWTGNAHLGEKLVITPEVDFLFYGIVGPYFRPQMWETFNMGVTAPPPDWDAKLDAGLDAKVGVVVKIFGKTLTTCDLPPYTTSVELWKAPDNLEIVSGDNQTGSLGQPLPNPIIAIVKDNLGNPLAGALVHFQIAQGGGSVSKEIVVTNSSGTAQTSWTLGSQQGVQAVNAIIKNSSGEVISTKAFNATTGEAYSISIFSGNTQSGTLGQPLANPIKVIVKDINGSPYQGVKVNFAANNNGSVSSSQVTTGSDGIASATWTLGPVDVTQTLTVTSFKSDNTTPLQGSPLTFTASATGTGMPCPGMPTITDPRDGQIYPTVQIGTQCWLQKNMNYNTGTSYCYNNNTTNCNTYGRLYDWQTAMGACPSGWHLPSDAEWTALTDFLGGEDIAGGKMKEAGTAHWFDPNQGATNSSGFTALPGGYYLNWVGYYQYLYQYAYFWSSTEEVGYPEDVQTRWLLFGLEDVKRVSGMKVDKYSARCIKD